MTSTLVQRLQPFVDGVNSAEAVVQEILADGLTDCLQRVSVAERIPIRQIEHHKQAVLARWKRQLQEPPKAVACRALTKRKRPCKKRARPLTEFCAHHERQREAHARDMAGRRQVLEHDAKVRAGKRQGHNHRWTYEEGFVADCAVCAECMPAGAAVSFSGQSRSSVDEAVTDDAPTSNVTRDACESAQQDGDLCA